jgi:predicted MPP superfamily phosphohydrolase
MSIEKHVTILQLSDLHFGKLKNNPLFFHEWIDSKDSSFESLCKEALDKYKIVPDIVVICGDFVCDGSDNEQFMEAATNIKKLCNSLNIIKKPSDWSRLIIVPGNHEVDRSESFNQKRLNKFITNFFTEVYSEADSDTKNERIPPIASGTLTDNIYNLWPQIIKGLS